MYCFIPMVVPAYNGLSYSTVSAFRGPPLIASPSTFRRAPDELSSQYTRITPRAKQSILDPKPENFPFHDDDTSGPPSDFTSELESVLQELSAKMSQLPVPSQEEPVEKESLPHKGDAYQQALHIATRRINNIPDEPEEEWTVEQRALYTLVKHHDDESLDEVERTEFPFSALAAPVDPTMTSSSRRSQTDPREIDDDIQSTLRNLRKRRKKLASERGERNSMEPCSLVPDTDDNNDFEFLRNHHRENAENNLRFSLQRARIVDFSRTVSEPCEMTAGVRRHFYEVWRVPFIYRPFHGIQDAFWRFDNPPCPRCGRSIRRRQSEKETVLCRDCHTRIYLQTPVEFGETGEPGAYAPWINKALKHEESEMADAAEKIALGLLETCSISEPKLIASPDGRSAESDETEYSREKGQVIKNVKSYDLSTTSGTDMNGIGGPPKRKRRSQGGSWNIRASDRSLRTINPIRNLIQNIDVVPNPDKEVIRLSVGDPTVYGNLSVSKKVMDKFCEVVSSGKANGYSMSMGGETARQAVANRYTSERSPLNRDDVILTVGASGALELALGAIANEGDNVLLPRPGFPLFRTIAEGFGIECRFYEVDPDNNWEIKLGDLTTLADGRTRAIVVNNPSNPCGSVYSASHIEDLLAVASVLKLPIIADEVYADMVFSDQTFTPIGVASVDVPVLSVGAISKQFVVPGWRLGWVLIHDRNKIFEKGQVRKGMHQLTTRMLVPNTPAQHVLPMMLSVGMGTLMRDLEANAEFTMHSLKGTRGLRVIQPQGAMYVMVEIDADKLGVEDDMDFVKQLLVEESVFVLPGQCFQAKNFVRIVFSAPKGVLAEAFSRMKRFCERRCG